VSLYDHYSQPWSSRRLGADDFAYHVFRDRACRAADPASNRVRRERSLSGQLSSHSQTVITRQPSRLSAAVVRRSRTTFSLNFDIQNSRLLFGV
jgi:hypothetical protein